MVEPAGKGRRLGVDDERECHHPEHASALGERLELPVGEIPWMVVHRAAARVRDREGQLFLEHVAPGLLGGVRKVEDDAELAEAADERPPAIASALHRRLDAAGELVRVVPGQARRAHAESYQSSNAPGSPSSGSTPSMESTSRKRRSASSARCGPGRRRSAFSSTARRELGLLSKRPPTRSIPRRDAPYSGQIWTPTPPASSRGSQYRSNSRSSPRRRMSSGDGSSSLADERARAAGRCGRRRSRSRSLPERNGVSHYHRHPWPRASSSVPSATRTIP